MVGRDQGGKHTNGYHALAVVIQILLDNLQQTRNRPPSRLLLRAVAAQIRILLLHLSKRDSEPPHHALIGDLVAANARATPAIMTAAGTAAAVADADAVALDDQAEVEDELVALVLWVGDGDGEAEHAVLAAVVGGRGRVDGDVAVEEALARDDVLLQHVEVEEARLALRGRLGHDAAWRGLGDDFGA